MGNRGICSLTVGYLFLAALGGPWGASTRLLRADDAATRNHMLAVRASATLLPRGHISRQPLDDQMARRWFDTFLLALDPQRMYFLADDVQQFAQSEADLDDLARQGDIEFPRTVLKRYLQRVEQATAWAQSFFAGSHDFTVDESVELRHDVFALDEATLRERWRKRIKFELLVEKANGVDPEAAKARLAGRYGRIARRAGRIDEEELIEIYLDALARAYDPHSRYFGARSMEGFSGSSIGIPFRGPWHEWHSE